MSADKKRTASSTTLDQQLNQGNERMTDVKFDSLTPEQKVAFRAEQKRGEVRGYLKLAGKDVEAFINNPRWNTNAKGNLVFNSILTIRPTYGGKFGYVIGGGQATFSEKEYRTREDAQRALWDAMQESAG